MKAKVIKFPWRNFPVTVPPGHKPASIIILPIVRIERNPDRPSDLTLGERLRAARKRRTLRRKLPKLNLVIGT